MLLFQPPEKKKKCWKKGGALLTWAVLNGLPSAPHHFSLSPLIFLWSVSHTNTHEELLFISHSTVAAFFGGFVLFLSDGGVIQCPFFYSLIFSFFFFFFCRLCIGSFCSGRGIIAALVFRFSSVFPSFFPPIFPIRKWEHTLHTQFNVG